MKMIFISDLSSDVAHLAASAYVVRQRYLVMLAGLARLKGLNPQKIDTTIIKILNKKD
jgi:hypothetical protein